MSFFKKFIPAAAAVLVSSLCAGPAHAGLGKWFKKEFVPTITGERPLRVKPYVSVQHEGKMRFKLSADSVYIHVAGVTVQTHQLQKRLAQAGCVIETGGNVLVCAPDIVAREVQKLVSEQRSAGQPGPHPPSPSSVGTLQPTGWDAGWRPPIVARCRLNDGAELGISPAGFIHAATPSGFTPPVGFVRRSPNPRVRFVLSDGRGVELPVDHAGRVLVVNPYGYVVNVVGSCNAGW